MRPTPPQDNVTDTGLQRGIRHVARYRPRAIFRAHSARTLDHYFRRGAYVPSRRWWAKRARLESCGRVSSAARSS